MRERGIGARYSAGSSGGDGLCILPKKTLSKIKRTNYEDKNYFQDWFLRIPPLPSPTVFPLLPDCVPLFGNHGRAGRGVRPDHAGVDRLVARAFAFASRPPEL